MWVRKKRGGKKKNCDHPSIVIRDAAVSVNEGRRQHKADGTEERGTKQRDGAEGRLEVEREQKRDEDNEERIKERLECEWDTEEEGEDEEGEISLKAKQVLDFWVWFSGCSVVII